MQKMYRVPIYPSSNFPYICALIILTKSCEEDIYYFPHFVDQYFCPLYIYVYIYIFIKYIIYINIYKSIYIKVYIYILLPILYIYIYIYIYIYLSEIQSLLSVGFYKTFPSYSLLFAVVQNLSNPSILQQLDASMWTGRVLFPNFSFPYRRSNKWNEAAQQPWEDALCWAWQNVGFPPIGRVRFVLKSEIKICILDSYIRITGKGGFNQENKRRLW